MLEPSKKLVLKKLLLCESSLSESRSDAEDERRKLFSANNFFLGGFFLHFFALFFLLPFLAAEWPACWREMDTKWMRPSPCCFFSLRLLPFLTPRLVYFRQLELNFIVSAVGSRQPYICLRNDSLTLGRLADVFVFFYLIFSLIFYNFIKSSLNGVNGAWWNGEGAESRREIRKSVCVCSIQPFSHTQSRGEDIPSAFALVLVWLSEGFQLTFSLQLFFSPLSPSCWL